LIVNSGAGAGFGPEWRRAGRATPSHSTLCIRGFSSSRLGTETGGPGARAELGEVPEQVWAQEDHGIEGLHVMAGHNGYAPTHGMTHMRDLHMSVDGRRLDGTDTLGAMTGRTSKRFDKIMERTSTCRASTSICASTCTRCGCSARHGRNRRFAGAEKRGNLGFPP
jgi:uncharacterized heparinase superfamily protein